MKSRQLTAAAALASAMLPAFAADIEGTSSGTFGSAVREANGSVTYNTAHNSIAWGNTVNSNTTRSRLTVAPAASPFSFTGSFDTPFAVADITYHNGRIDLNTGIRSVVLTMPVAFATAAIGSFTTDYKLKIVNTNNDGSPADYVTFADAFTATSFSDAAYNYSFTLLGFGAVSGNGRVDTDGLRFHVGEEREGTAELLAVMTRKPINPVPEPETYALMLAGLAAVGAVTRRRQAHRG